jgi:hypothetical protein
MAEWVQDFYASTETISVRIWTNSFLYSSLRKKFHSCWKKGPFFCLLTFESPVVTIWPPGLAFTILRSVHNAFMCPVRISVQTSIISLYNINWLVCITEAESIYCAVRDESSHQTDRFSSLKGQYHFPLSVRTVTVPATSHTYNYRFPPRSRWELPSVPSEDGTDSCSRNVGDKLPLLAAL